jgi:hypothetical protein
MTDAEKIDLVLDYFDFKKVRRVMKALDWVWVGINRVPETKQIRSKAEYLLNELNIKNYKALGTGGLVAEKTEEGDYILRFVLEEVDSYELGGE